MRRTTLTRRTFLKTVGAAAAGAAALQVLGRRAGAAGADKPNVIIIYADDQGYGDLSCYGAQKLKTPHIDALAAEGMKFTNFYVTAPVCSPTRTSLMTACYPKRVGMHRHVLFPNSTRGMNPSEVTIAELLKGRGYATACVGKWHLGFQKQFLPTSQGFDSYFGIPFSNDMSLPVNMTFAKDVRLDEGLDLEKLKAGEKRRSTVPLMRNEEVIDYPVDQSTLTERYTEEAVAFLTANKDRPFFLYLPHTMPHYPLHISARFKGKSEGGLFGDVIECIDWSCGQIVETLRRLGIEKKTIVVYTSDNGPAAGSAGPLRGKKGSTWEGGMREPCIMWAPGRIPAGTVCHELATIMDLLPTFAGLAGAKVPDDRVIDGHDIWPLMSGRAGAKSPYDAFFYYSAQGNIEAVRQGDWKYRMGTGRPRAKKGDKTPPPKPKAELYNLKEDIGEKTNLIEKHPDIAQRLAALMTQFDKDLEKTSRPPGEA
ncbi:MAG TPA: sulfatase [Phycisphaerae bacterium]|nr:sulfatase [Phycisphaerae bacterium]